MSRRRIEEEDIDTLVEAADEKIDRLMSGSGGSHALEVPQRAFEDAKGQRRNELARLFRARESVLRLKSSAKRTKSTSTKKAADKSDKPRAGWRGSSSEEQPLEQQS